MKKILGLTIAALLVMALVGGGTWAYFSDTETGTGSITAGTLDITAGGTTTFSLTNQAPGIAATTGIDLSLTNNGSIIGNLEIALSGLLNPENTASAIELLQGGETTGNGPTDGELGGLVEIAIWIDRDNDGTWSSLDSYLPPLGGAAVVWVSGSVVPSAAWDDIDAVVGGAGWSAANVGVAIPAGGGVEDFILEDRWLDSGTNSDNIAQSDGVSFDIDFTVKQQ